MKRRIYFSKFMRNIPFSYDLLQKIIRETISFLPVSSFFGMSRLNFVDTVEYLPTQELSIINDVLGEKVMYWKKAACKNSSDNVELKSKAPKRRNLITKTKKSKIKK